MRYMQFALTSYLLVYKLGIFNVLVKIMLSGVATAILLHVIGMVSVDRLSIFPIRGPSRNSPIQDKNYSLNKLIKSHISSCPINTSQ